MSLLQTYDRATNLQGEPMPWPFTIIGHEEGYRAYAPGEWVTHDTLGGTGMIVAVNDEQMTVLWSVLPREKLNGFANLAMPLVRRVFAPQIAQQLVSVQPMTVPSGLTFYLDYTYGDKLANRCNNGPLWSRLFWRAWRCISGRTRTCWQSLRSWAASWSTKRSITVESVAVDKQEQVLETLLKDRDKVAKLVSKWSKVLPPADKGP